MTHKPILLLILDGWGYRRPVTDDNAIEVGNTPTWHKLLNEYPNSIIKTSGFDVGLPDGQMGNSEVGHTNLGAGRVVMQDLPRIDLAIKDGSLEQNQVIVDTIKTLKANGKALNIVGLMSDGGVHSHQNHIVALCNIFDKNGIKVNVHAFMDGRDTPPTSGKGYLNSFEDAIKDMSNVKICSIAGRFYAMDRDNRWDRVENAYNTIALGEGEHAISASEAIEKSYAAGATDEFATPTAIGDYKGFEEGDAIFMANYRSDRAREILYALGDKEFASFDRQRFVAPSCVVGLAEYSSDHNRFVNTVFPPQSLDNIYGEIIANQGMTQLRIAETEKYAHVTFFFNGGKETEFDGEDRILIPSPKVATYDLKPEMSAYEVTEKLVEAIKANKYDTIICNLANGDMVGHTGIMEAALQAVEVIDNCVKKITDAIIEVNGTALITADHGNVEQMKDENGNPYTAHTVGDVQAILVNSEYKSIADGRLADIAPTLLKLLGLEQPTDMTGKSLV